MPAFLSANKITSFTFFPIAIFSTPLYLKNSLGKARIISSPIVSNCILSDSASPENTGPIGIIKAPFKSSTLLGCQFGFGSRLFKAAFLSKVETIGFTPSCQISSCKIKSPKRGCPSKFIPKRSSASLSCQSAACTRVLTLLKLGSCSAEVVMIFMYPISFGPTKR